MQNDDNDYYYYHNYNYYNYNCVACVQSVHSEVDRRCRGISDSLNKYLRVMRCVSLDEVLTVRDRIEHVRAKADNIVILSANRLIVVGA